MANGKPWYRINLNLRKRVRELKRKRREQRERSLHLHDRIPDEARGILLGLCNDIQSAPAHIKYKK